MKTEWNKVTAMLCDMHNTHGAGAVLFQPDTARLEGAGTLLNLMSDEKLFSRPGKHLTRKQLRQWLWEEHRKSRGIQRERGLLWSAYDEEDNRSYVGIGALVKEQVAERLDKKRELFVGA